MFPTLRSLYPTHTEAIIVFPEQCEEGRTFLAEALELITPENCYAVKRSYG